MFSFDLAKQDNFVTASCRVGLHSKWYSVPYEIADMQQPTVVEMLLKIFLSNVMCKKISNLFQSMYFLYIFFLFKPFDLFFHVSNFKGV